MKEFGYPPVFPDCSTSSEDEAEPTDLTKVKKKVKSKVAAKDSGIAYQWNIMRSLGLKDEEIREFADPHKWLKHFPPIARSSLRDLGCKVNVLAYF